VVLFQPHRYSRTKHLLDEFPAAFRQADQLFLTDIYPAGETPIPGVTGERLAEAFRAAGAPPTTYVSRKDRLVDTVLPTLKRGDVVVALGAGDIGQLGRALFERLG
jgi:UDP-N-acetylmuramate--alanine ligase